MKTNILGLALAVAVSSSAATSASPESFAALGFTEDPLMASFALEKETHLFAAANASLAAGSEAPIAASPGTKAITVNASAVIDFMEVGERLDVGEPADEIAPRPFALTAHEPAGDRPPVRYSRTRWNGEERVRQRTAAPEPTVSLLALVAGSLLLLVRTRRFS